MPKMVKNLQGVGCKIGKKTTCLGSNLGVRKFLTHLLKSSNVKSQTSTAAKDLGILTSAGGRRRFSTMVQRLKMAKMRAERVGILTKQNRRATILYKTGV